MNEVIKFIVDFGVMFIFFYLIYIFFINKKKKDYNKLKKNDDVRVFILKYNLDIKKINYKKLLNVIAFINSFIISFTSTIIVRIDSVAWSIVFCFALILTLIYSLTEIAGRYFIKEQNKYVEKEEEKKEEKELKEKKKEKIKDNVKEVKKKKVKKVKEEK